MIHRPALADPVLEGVDADRVFQALCGAARVQDRDGSFQVGLWFDRLAALHDWPRWLPRPEHGSLEGWVRIVLQARGATEVCLAAFELQAYDPHLWEAGCRAMLSLFPEGVPLGVAADLDAFVGHYATTPRGIHRDVNTTWMHVLSGTKRLHFWPEDAFDPGQITGSGRSTTLVDRVEPHLHSALEIVGNPGQTVAWPASSWHVAHQDRAAHSVAINVGLAPVTARQVAAPLTELLEQAASALLDASRPEPRIAEVREQLLRLLEGADTSDLVRQQCLEQDLRHRSALGFGRTPALATVVPSQASGPVRAGLPQRIAWRDTPRGPLGAAAGHLFPDVLQPTEVALLSALAAGETCQLGAPGRLWEWLLRARVLVPAA